MLNNHIFLKTKRLFSVRIYFSIVLNSKYVGWKYSTHNPTFQLYRIKKMDTLLMKRFSMKREE